MTWLATGDLHFTDKKIDEYRFKLFDVLIDLCHKYDVTNLFILGDITDAKDRHSSILVNRIVEGFNKLDTECPDTFIHLLKGNHDYIDPDYPFFGFLDQLDNVKYISKTTQYYVEDHNENPMRCGFIPAGSSIEDTGLVLSKLDFCFLHNCFNGAISETGFTLEGAQAAPFKEVKYATISGDIHFPQEVGPIIYAGSPYMTRFGPDYEPRVLLIDEDNEVQSIPLTMFPRKVYYDVSVSDDTTLAESLEEPVELESNDHVKIRLHIDAANAHKWAEYKSVIYAECEKRGYNIQGFETCLYGDKDNKKPKKSKVTVLDPVDLVTEYWKEENVDSLTMEIGMLLLGREGELDDGREI